ncbi:MAG: hypothetical protein LQ338_003381 [Usnochroma carphineum]|nr:MAG: hypothetical protein LQ338_003381 [Usnochroma carphineum]
MFNRQLVHAAKANINTAGITSMVVKNSLPAGKSANKVALSLLKRRDKSSKSVQRLLEEAAGDDELSRRNAMLEQHFFLPYARQFWLEHTKQRIVPTSGKLWRLWCNLLEDAGWRDTLSHSPWTFEDWYNRSTNVVEWTVENNHCSLAQLLVDSETRLTQENLEILFEGAAARGCDQLLEVCLGLENIPQTALDGSLQLAAGGGHLAIVEKLLQEKVNVNPTNYGLTPLQAAARGGHLAVVERLLQHNADVNAAPDYTGMIALEAAAEGGYLAVVDKLLQEKADVNASAFGRTALLVAAEGGHLAVVERLLQENADVNAAAAIKYGRTALQAAIEKGHLEVIERLRAAGAK